MRSHAYLIVGGLTTGRILGSKFLANFLLFDNTMYPTPFQNIVLSIINWTAGVIFAYFIQSEICIQESCTDAVRMHRSSLLSRSIHTDPGYGSEQVLTAVGVNLLIATVISAVLVIIGNYVFSKLFVFNKKKDDGAEEAK